MTQDEKECAECDRAMELIDWVLDSPGGRRFLFALDRLGWRIAPKDPSVGDLRYPAPSLDKRKKWPSWIDNDYWKEKPKLRVIDGGKKDEA